jgi:parallel beta-helix repeat protein
MARVVKWILGIMGVIVLLFVGAFVVAALVPGKQDPVVDVATSGAGSSSVVPAYSGLQREFPATNAPADSTSSAEAVELGHLLFFDPILSENDDVSCASCHHPDLGFSDGRPTAVGASGRPVARNAPGLWNVAFAQTLFWDGREPSLEDQATFPLTHPDEMGVTDVSGMVLELQAIPEYAAQFDAVFGGGEMAVSAENVNRALAAFQRSLISDDSPFDRYAAGDFNALTPQQRRGLAVFRSGATRCFECHTAPTFASDTFRIIGVESDDPGRAGVVADGQPGAFKVPSLRNVALSAPYMHNGSMATLDEVVTFYEAGGGRPHGATNVDVFVNGFDLTDQEHEDLVAFLYALTDESRLPAIPTAVPSGLRVVAAIDNPERAVAASHNVGSANAATAARTPMTIRVEAGESIQSAVDRAQPGDTIEIPFGTYHERVVVDLSDITLRGLPNEAGDYPILDGQGVLSEGVIASGNNFTVGFLQTINYTDNGILVEGANGVHFHDLYAENVGTYGIYPVKSSNVLVERVEVTGVDDAGIYAGQCENVIIRDSLAYGNVIGIEIENSYNGEIRNNHVYDNSVGIFVVILPQLTSKISSNTLITGNLSDDNNHDNFARGGAASLLPPGVGVLLLGTDNAEVTGNTIRGNATAGVAVFSLTGTGAFAANELDVGELPEGNWVHSNTYENNGFAPDPMVADLGVPGGDILWDVTGTNNRFDDPSASAFPPLLPSDNWPRPARNAYENILTVLVGLIG